MHSQIIFQTVHATSHTTHTHETETSAVLVVFCILLFFLYSGHSVGLDLRNTHIKPGASIILLLSGQMLCLKTAKTNQGSSH